MDQATLDAIASNLKAAAPAPAPANEPAPPAPTPEKQPAPVTPPSNQAPPATPPPAAPAPEAAEATESKVDPQIADHLKWMEDDGTAGTTPAPAGTPAKPAEPSEDEKIAKQLLNDPLAAALVAHVKAGKPVSDFTKELQPPDFNGKSNQDIYLAEVQKYGQLTEDQVEEELQKFNSLPLLQQNQIVGQIKGDAQKAFNDKVSQYVPKNNTEFIAQAKQNAAKELDETINQMAGKYYYGLLMTPDVADEIKSYVTKYARVNENGDGYDIPASIREAVTLNDKLFKRLLKANIDIARAKGYDEVISERNRPDKEMSPGLSPAGKLGISDAIGEMITKRQK